MLRFHLIRCSFLDEIQAIPEALPALRYFYEDMAELPLLAAGSLLEFALSNRKFSMPVGRVEYLRMGPMCFTEFLEAMNEPGLAKLFSNIRQATTLRQLCIVACLSSCETIFLWAACPKR